MAKQSFYGSFKEELKDYVLLAYIVSVIVILIIFNIFKDKSTTINVASLFLLAFIQIIYGIREAKKAQSILTWEKYNSVGFGCLILIFAVINLAIKVNEPKTATLLFLLMSLLLILGYLVIFFGKMWSSKTIIGLIVSYILLISCVNYLFALFYALGIDSGYNSIVDSEGNTITGALNIVYYSYSNFYTSVQGMRAQGISSAISIVQVMSSYLIHVILLGIILQRNICNYGIIDEKKSTRTVKKPKTAP